MIIERSRRHTKSAFRRLRPQAPLNRPSPSNGWQIASAIITAVATLARVVYDYAIMDAVITWWLP